MDLKKIVRVIWFDGQTVVHLFVILLATVLMYGEEFTESAHPIMKAFSVFGKMQAVVFVYVAVMLFLSVILLVAKGIVKIENWIKT